MVFIIGVDHLIQYSGPVPEALRDEFRNYLIETAQAKDISLIAEEFSREALVDVYHSSKDTAQEAAVMLNIQHRYCDPEESELRALGIPYFAEIRDGVMRSNGVTGSIIIDDALRTKIRAEAIHISRFYWQARESSWYRKILPDINSNILFICGHEHAERFKALLRDNGHQCLIFNPYWREDIFNDYTNINLD
jgi:hypothetical protein